MAMKTKADKKTEDKPLEQFPRTLSRKYVAADRETRKEICAAILARAEGDVSAIRLLLAVESIHAAELQKTRESHPLTIQVIYGDELNPRDIEYTREKGREYVRAQLKTLEHQRQELEKRLAGSLAPRETLPVLPEQSP